MSKTDAIKSWNSLMLGKRAFTNYAGSETHANFVAGTNLDADCMQLQPMACGGAILKKVDRRMIRGADCIGFQAINALGDYRKYNPVDHWWLFFQPTSSVREEIWKNSRWTGTWRENISRPFGQYGGKSILPILAVGDDVNYIPFWRVRFLLEGEAFPSPFVY
jgi:hypothetical protein